MGPISLTTAIDAPRERVFDLLSDLSRRPAYTDHFLRDFRLERLEAAGVGAAARFRADARGGIRYMETVIAEAERPHKIVEHGRGGRWDRIPVRAVWELTQGPGAVTTLTLTFWTAPSHPLDRLRDLLGASGWWRRRWSRALRRLRELIESGRDPGEGVRVAGSDRFVVSAR
jgi:uncharacterized protein YndB with AHSA1/START domain